MMNNTEGEECTLHCANMILLNFTNKFLPSQRNKIHINVSITFRRYIIIYTTDKLLLLYFILSLQ